MKTSTILALLTALLPLATTSPLPLAKALPIPVGAAIITGLGGSSRPSGPSGTAGTRTGNDLPSSDGDDGDSSDDTKPLPNQGPGVTRGEAAAFDHSLMYDVEACGKLKRFLKRCE